MSKEFTNLVDSKGNPKIAPVQGYVQGIPWSLHLEAYNAYSKRWAPQPALIDLEGRGCRGGFSVGELDDFIPGWRDKVSEIAKLKAEIAELRAALAASPPVPAAVAGLTDALDVMALHTNWELSTESDDGELVWVVHEVVGSPNDRYWHKISDGPTPRAAIESAIAAKKG